MDAGTGLRSAEDGGDDGGGMGRLVVGMTSRWCVGGWLAGHGRWEEPRASGGHGRDGTRYFA